MVEKSPSRADPECRVLRPPVPLYMVPKRWVRESSSKRWAPKKKRRQGSVGQASAERVSGRVKAGKQPSLSLLRTPRPKRLGRSGRSEAASPKWPPKRAERERRMGGGGWKRDVVVVCALVLGWCLCRGVRSYQIGRLGSSSTDGSQVAARSKLRGTHRATTTTSASNERNNRELVDSRLGWRRNATTGTDDELVWEVAAQLVDQRVGGRQC